MLEALETRRLFAIVAVDDDGAGNYIVRGSEGVDKIAVVIGIRDRVAAVVDETGAGWPLQNVQSISIFGNGGADTISVEGQFPPDDPTIAMVGVGVWGGDGDDVITIQTIAQPVVLGGDHNDRIMLTRTYGGEVVGEAGDDRLVNNHAIASSMWGGPGNDDMRAHGQSEFDAFGVFFNGNDGNDLIHGSGDSDRLFGGEGTDEIYGYAGNDTIILTDSGRSDPDFADAGEHPDDWDVVETEDFTWDYIINEEEIAWAPHD